MSVRMSWFSTLLWGAVGFQLGGPLGAILGAATAARLQWERRNRFRGYLVYFPRMLAVFAAVLFCWLQAFPLPDR